MRTTTSENAHTLHNRWRIYEALKRIAQAESITPAGYDECLAAITEELGL
jgi:hypothetical protein